ncbi:hypothetical protein E4U02_07460 [Microbacterium paludicola]|jgi:hypothetical protein|uniref:Uncharacterized protein n=2 Tax=Microbacterium paludicola TaxID=300019 RepID=A0A4Y9FWX3_9MICO|nr:hypothetical protein [Microbacterium paludicola]MBF0816242.1 hypothetical protein [Microbacterium paludicola]TFU33046.1 hypothetical protein E4U02_07460 [Microbacterium paludicola]
MLLGAATLVTVSACAPVENTLATHLGTPLETFPAVKDEVYTLSLTQDDRLGELPRDANQVRPDETGWIIVAICADTPAIDPAVTKNVVLRVVAEEFLDGDAKEEIEDGALQDGVVCGNAASIAPRL